MSYLKTFYTNKKKIDPSYQYSSAMKDAAEPYKKDKGKGVAGPTANATGKTRRKFRRGKSRRSGKSRRIKKE